MTSEKGLGKPMSLQRPLKYVGWAIVASLSAWLLFIVARLGNTWVSVGMAAFLGLIVLINRLTRKPTPKTVQLATKHREISTDQDRWGGGWSL